MKYSIGYQIRREDQFVDYIITNKDKIGEVYFAWGDFPNGRNIQIDHEEFEPYESIEKQKRDLEKFAKAEIATNVLFNGNCYGRESQSREFFNKIGVTFDFLQRKYGTKTVTTTSVLIAKFIKENFSNVDVRASVNIGIETSFSAAAICKYFDSYYAARELNRNIDALHSLHNWCQENGKKLYGLANSGCFSRCPARTFHDNLVAHEREISAMDNGYAFKGICAEYFEGQNDKNKIISGISFIRPEDVALYESVYDGLKLATRVTAHPINVCSAYFEGKYFGGITDLLEPNHSRHFYPMIVDNSRFPADFGEKTKNCKQDCGKCHYCSGVYKQALVNLDIGTFKEL